MKKAQFLLTVEVDDEADIDEILPSVIDDGGDETDAQWTLERVSTRLNIGRAVR